MLVWDGPHTRLRKILLRRGAPDRSPAESWRTLARADCIGSNTVAGSYVTPESARFVSAASTLSYDCVAFCSSRHTRSRESGSSCGRTPIALRTAFARAGETGLNGASLIDLAPIGPSSS